MGRGGLSGTSFEGEGIFATMNSSVAEELQIPGDSNMAVGKFLRGEEPYFPWSATGIRSPFHATCQQDSFCKVGSPEESDLNGFGLPSFPDQELLAQSNSSMITNPDDKLMPGSNSCWTTALETIDPDSLTLASMQLPIEVLDPPFPHPIPECFNSSPRVHYESMQIPWAANSGHTLGSFRHCLGSPFQVKNWSLCGKLSQVSKRQRPLMLQRWMERIVPMLEWSKLRLNFLEVEHDGGDRVGSGELERSPDAVMQAVNHKMKERIRRSEFNGKMQSLISLVPTIKKKDKVSVLTSTIEYIRELSCAVGTRAPPLQKPSPNKTTAKMKSDSKLLLHSGAPDGELVEAGGELEGSSRSTKFVPVTTQTVAAADTPSSSHPAPDFMLVETACGGDTLNVSLDMETLSPAHALIRLLRVLRKLHLHLLKIECGSEHGRLNATMSVTMPLDQNLSCDQVRQALQRVLDYGSLQSSSSN